MNHQEQHWAGAFGDAYTKRNRVDWLARMPFWSRIVAMVRPRSVLEIGCNAGWNLMAIRALGWYTALHGIDINNEAAQQARDIGLHVDTGTLDTVPDLEADMVFTAGMLIHVAPDDIEPTMRKIVAAAKRHVLAVEYEHSFEQEVEYREPKMLWRRPFGALYEKLGLRLCHTEQPEGFDRCTAWLLEKR